jgi:hypothetical protein
MRNVMVCLAAAAALAACDPAIRKFEVTPASLQCAGQVTVNWDISGPGGELSTSKPVNPPLPSNPTELIGSRVVTVTETTEFSFIVPGAGHKHQVVNVSGQPKAKTLTFTGVCNDAVSNPIYNAVTVSAAEGPGLLTSISSNADWPVHVFINGADIALQAGGGPIGPLPQVAAAGTYTAAITGNVIGPANCKLAFDQAGGGGEPGGPTGGGNSGPVAAPPFAVTIMGSCQ